MLNSIMKGMKSSLLEETWIQAGSLTRMFCYFWRRYIEQRLTVRFRTNLFFFRCFFVAFLVLFRCLRRTVLFFHWAALSALFLHPTYFRCFRRLFTPTRHGEKKAPSCAFGAFGASLLFSHRVVLSMLFSHWRGMMLNWFKLILQFIKNYNRASVFAGL